MNCHVTINRFGLPYRLSSEQRDDANIRRSNTSTIDHLTDHGNYKRRLCGQPQHESACALGTQSFEMYGMAQYSRSLTLIIVPTAAVPTALLSFDIVERYGWQARRNSGSIILSDAILKLRIVEHSVRQGTNAWIATILRFIT